MKGRVDVPKNMRDFKKGGSGVSYVTDVPDINKNLVGTQECKNDAKELFQQYTLKILKYADKKHRKYEQAVLDLNHNTFMYARKGLRAGTVLNYNDETGSYVLTSALVLYILCNRKSSLDLSKRLGISSVVIRRLRNNELKEFEFEYKIYKILRNNIKVDFTRTYRGLNYEKRVLNRAKRAFPFKYEWYENEDIVPLPTIYAVCKRVEGREDEPMYLAFFSSQRAAREFRDQLPQTQRRLEEITASGEIDVIYPIKSIPLIM